MAARMTLAEDIKAFDLATNQGLSNRQVAQAMGRDDKSVENALGRHRARLASGELRHPPRELTSDQRTELGEFLAWLEAGRDRGWLALAIGVSHGKASGGNGNGRT
jgi:transposase